MIKAKGATSAGSLASLWLAIVLSVTCKPAQYIGSIGEVLHRNRKRHIVSFA